MRRFPEPVLVLVLVLAAATVISGQLLLLIIALYR